MSGIPLTSAPGSLQVQGCGLPQMPGPSCRCHLLWVSFPPSFLTTHPSLGVCVCVCVIVALNPSLHFTFSTVLLCLCVWGDVREPSSILGPRDVGWMMWDMGCGSSIVLTIEQVLSEYWYN